MYNYQSPVRQWIQKRQINGYSSGYDIHITISDALSLEFKCYHEKDNILYYYKLNQQELKKQNVANGVNFIESSSELYQYLDMMTKENPGKFSDYIKINKDHLIINLQFKIDFKMGTKKKILYYQFILMKQSISQTDKLKNKINRLSQQQEIFKEISRHEFEALKKQNQKLKQQMQIMRQTMTSLQAVKNQENVDQKGNTFKFLKNSPMILIKYDHIIQTANKWNALLLSQSLDHQHIFQCKLRIQNKQNIFIGISTTQIFKSQTYDDLRMNRLLLNQTFYENQIVTITFFGDELKCVVQHSNADSEEEEESQGQWAYNRRNQTVKCKELIKANTYYPCLVMSFGAKIEFLGFTKNKKNY